MLKLGFDPNPLAGEENAMERASLSFNTKQALLKDEPSKTRKQPAVMRKLAGG